MVDERGNGQPTNARPGILDELHSPFLIGGVAVSLFLDVSPEEPRQWCLVGEDESGVIHRMPIPRAWALELLAWGSGGCAERNATASPAELAAALMASAEARQPNPSGHP